MGKTRRKPRVTAMQDPEAHRTIAEVAQEIRALETQPMTTAQIEALWDECQAQVRKFYGMLTPHAELSGQSLDTVMGMANRAKRRCVALLHNPEATVRMYKEGIRLMGERIRSLPHWNLHALADLTLEQEYRTWEDFENLRKSW